MDIFREKKYIFFFHWKIYFRNIICRHWFYDDDLCFTKSNKQQWFANIHGWIIISIFFLTLGELCVSPVGLSIMAKVAPDLIKNQIMGLWFVASALGNFVAGLIGGNVNIKNIDQLPNIFGQCMWMLFVVALLLFIAKKPIYKILNEKNKQLSN
ncbi:peptide MFS transporter [Campylobacter jejuni]|nr:peptide MFS transporter [Campylobacter jejuni]ECL7198138.1 peptide MFS transporter [Campylobacter jejuni]ECL9078906.1 peptide MFS transporter [Campylobacter jejuni]EDP4071540.1 peptide MFS transporter [Campylobacter jejuni]EDP4136537.1 peptide MFS transporter [Campylobacter jejuni]